MATMSTERPGFWRAPKGYHTKPRPQSCIWSPPSQSPYDSNSLPRSPKVQSGSPASDAGLRSGDVLLHIGNRSTTSPPITHSAARDLINTSGNTLNVHVQRPQGRSPGPPLSPSVSPAYSSEPPSSHTPYRPLPTNRGVIPNITPGYESSIRKPESNTEGYLREKAREQWAITKQTYRTLPLIEPRPKVRRDWCTGSYLRHMEGPTWHDLPRTLTPQPPKLQDAMSKYGQGVNQNNPGVVHLQYNSPINVYSEENVANVLMPRPYSPRPGQPIPPPMVQMKNQLQKPLTVDITQSPTYQLLHEEEEDHREYNAAKDRLYTVGSGQHTGPGHSPRYSPIGQHSPSYPIQTPYFRSLMNSLLPNPGV